MTQKQKSFVETKLIFLDKKDVRELTGWGKNTIDNLFANNKDFPSIKIGKKYQVELEAFIAFFKTRQDYK